MSNTSILSNEYVAGELVRNVRSIKVKVCFLHLGKSRCRSGKIKNTWRRLAKTMATLDELS